uniref:Carbohydrate deacetylase n=1 Tax=Mandrillus leucophaeus TaxID=9568 RepID=A0A2K5ZSG1_MANLE
RGPAGHTYSCTAHGVAGLIVSHVARVVAAPGHVVTWQVTEPAAHLSLQLRIPLCAGWGDNVRVSNRSTHLWPWSFFLGKMGFREAVAAGDVDLPQVREELEAQLSCFRELMGRAPTHVDGHQHVHVLPGVCQVFAEALQAYGVRFTRLPLERGVGGCTWLEAPARAFACAVERDARAAVGPFSRHGLRWTDAFVGLSTCGRHMSAHRVSGALARVLEGTLAGHTLTAELMAHPGYPSVPPTGGCGEGPDAFSCSWERLHELRVLTAPTLRTRLAQDGVQLCALDDLDSKRPGEEVPCEATLEPFLEPSLL